MSFCCKSCRYWERDPRGNGVRGHNTDGRYSNCRRRAPVFVGTEGTDCQFAGRGTVWPVTAADDWCGEFQA